MKKCGFPLVLIQFILLLPALNTGHSQAPNDWGLRLNTNYSSHYTGGGDRALLDGIRGNEDFRSPAWQGYLGVDLDVVVDLGRSRDLRSVSVGFLQDSGSWIFMPTEVDFWVAQDEANFRKAGTVENDLSPERSGVHIEDFALELGGDPIRFIRVIGRNRGVCPDQHPGAGQKAWVFADEIVIR
ncbi:MAG: hypothetical protein WBB73_11495 [Candidatus Aminicenantaceae bacterium]